MDIADDTVHIVDDEEPVRKSLTFLLTMAGFTVRPTNRRPPSSRPRRRSAVAASSPICACQT